MPRPRKCRKVCCLPDNREFLPSGLKSAEGEVVEMTVDEYETIRLIDHEGFSQEQCGGYMQIARTTAQQIYESARRKLSRVLVDGLPLRIEGGDFRLCDGNEPDCGCGGCERHRCRWAAGHLQESEKAGMLLSSKQNLKPEESKMKIAVTFENGQVFQHFGHTAQFKLYQVENGQIQESAVVDTNGSSHGALAGFLKAQGADTLICGGIGGGAQQALDAAGIKLYGGVTGDADSAVRALLGGKLDYNPDVLCSHHEGHEGGSCGEHGCGQH